jgi:hypothetical protein
VVRKAVIIVLTLAAVGTAASYFASIWFGFGYCNFGVRGDNSIAVFEGAVIFLKGKADPSGFRGWYHPADRFILLPQRIDSYSVTVPLWIPLVVCGTYPTIAFIRGPLRRWRRRRKGLCLRCGYNLMGNVSGVCSECGTEIEQP